MDLRSRYRAYLACCNERRWDDLEDYVHDPATVNGRSTPLAEYVTGLRTVVAAFEDYHWRIAHDVVEGDRIAVTLIDSGTNTGEWHGVRRLGTTVQTHELASYRFEGERIAEVWVCGDDLATATQLGARLGPCA